MNAHTQDVTAASRNKLSSIIVMGVSGSGKSTIVAALAKTLSFTAEDGDTYHPESNVAKMHSGKPLTDDDRWPWLRAIGHMIDQRAEAGKPVVVSCSALKRAYREVLIHGRNDVQIVYLKGSRDLIAARLARRTDHFMPASLLDSQFATIEEPKSEEGIITVSIDATVDGIVANIVTQLRKTRHLSV